MTTDNETLAERTKALGLYGLLANWMDVMDEAWLPYVIDIEEIERARRSLERRISAARLGNFKDMADFDWTWPEKIDREHIQELFDFSWIDEAANVVLVGPNGVGKTMIAKNLAHRALLRGVTVKCVSASALLNDLAAQEGAIALQRRVRHYLRPALLVIDELGYLSYDNRHADLLFEVVTRRYGNKSVLITTNKPFAEWNEVFPSATCVVTLVDRLVHNAEILQINGDSYRLKEAKEKTAKKARARAAKRKASSKKG